MPKFKIYAGLSGGFGGAQYYGIHECADEDEAEAYAREQAVEQYESYGGYHGLYTWESMRQEIADTEYGGDIEQVDPDDVEMLQDLVMAAVNEALRLGEQTREETMNAMTPAGMGGLF